ncbi:hypothetical protein PF049_00215 [Erythrobacteraceae bacterium WH01K]|nr:hypothetical protein PF049_00215 [Erythrobacteraceae bacterium WH01K]
MATYLINTLPFDISESDEQATNPASNLNNDFPNMVWKSNGRTGAHVNVRVDVDAEWDTVALYDCNLQAGDTVRLRAANSPATTVSDPLIDQTLTVDGETGESGNLVFYHGGAIRGLNNVRLDITFAAGNPATEVQASRLIVGIRLEADGIDVGSDFNFEDPSRIENYRGIQIVDAYDMKQSWKFSISNVDSVDFVKNWRSFLRANNGKTILFIPDTVNGLHHQESILGRIQGQTNAGLVSSDTYRINLYIREA